MNRESPFTGNPRMVSAKRLSWGSCHVLVLEQSARIEGKKMALEKLTPFKRWRNLGLGPATESPARPGARSSTFRSVRRFRKNGNPCGFGFGISSPCPIRHPR